MRKKHECIKPESEVVGGKILDILEYNIRKIERKREKEREEREKSHIDIREGKHALRDTIKSERTFAIFGERFVGTS